ncbi:MAG: hypothetical protein DWI02_05400 [Planctomycetota bacterium]|nr:MAG: hypothetical protein DWI02_05400 [Planctomycetota bacterium]
MQKSAEISCDEIGQAPGMWALGWWLWHLGNVCDTSAVGPSESCGISNPDDNCVVLTTALLCGLQQR